MLTKLYDTKWLKLYDRDNWFFVTRSDEELEDKQTPDCVVIIAKNEKEELLLIHEFRVPLNKWLWAFPAGTLNPGEDVVDTAIRECFEETGTTLVIEDVLLNSYTSPGLTNEKIALVYGKVTGELSNKHIESHEKIVPHFASIPAQLNILKEDMNMTTHLATYLMNKFL